MKVRRVSPSVLPAAVAESGPTGAVPDAGRDLGPGLGAVMAAVASDPTAVFQVVLGDGETPSSFRLHFERTRVRLGADEARLITSHGSLYVVGARPRGDRIFRRARRRGEPPAGRRRLTTEPLPGDTPAVLRSRGLRVRRTSMGMGVFAADGTYPPAIATLSALSDGHWVVKPPSLDPHEGSPLTRRVARAVAAMIARTSRLPVGLRAEALGAGFATIAADIPGWAIAATGGRPPERKNGGSVWASAAGAPGLQQQHKRT